MSARCHAIWSQPSILDSRFTLRWRRLKPTLLKSNASAGDRSSYSSTSNSFKFFLCLGFFKRFSVMVRSGGGRPIPRRARRRASVPTLNFDFFFLDGTSCDPAFSGQNGISRRFAQSFYFLLTHCKLNRTAVHPPGKLAITEARSPADIAAVRKLFVEYATWLDFSLAYQNFDEELASLPGKYASPRGRLLLASVEDAPAGCGAIRQLEPLVCEMKRLFVRPEFRGCGLGQTLAKTLIGNARGIGYSAMRLDTVAEKMGDAVCLYKSLGFREIPAYYPNARSGTLYFELRLNI